MKIRRGRPEDITEAYYRGLMHAVGYRRKDIDKPQIAVVNSWTEVNPGHQPLRALADRVKEGIWAAGGSTNAVLHLLACARPWPWSPTAASPVPPGDRAWAMSHRKPGKTVDLIEIDIPEKRLRLRVPGAELKQRKKQKPTRPDHPAHGLMAAYRRAVGGAETGAVWL